MSYIKFVNETAPFKTYDHLSDIDGLIYYMFQIHKTSEDSKRADTDITDYVGCVPFIYPKEYEYDPYFVTQFMKLSHMIKRPQLGGELIKHRIISFDTDELMLARDLNSLGRGIARYYSEGYLGGHYITAYAIHKDTYNLHIHIAVNTVDYITGNYFHVDFEYNHLKALVDHWYSKYDKTLLNNIGKLDSRKTILYGDGMRVNRQALSAEEQIKINYNYCHNIK